MDVWNWNKFTGLSDDSFLWRSGEFLDCSNVDVIDNAWYIDWTKHPSMSEIWTSIWQITYCKDSWTYPIFWTSTGTYFGFWGFNSSISDWWQTGAYLAEIIWTDSLPVAYWFKNWYIRQQSYNWAWNPFNSVITTNVPSWIPTASCMGAGRIYFAVLNKIYVLDTAVTDPTAALSQVKATPANSNIPFWYTIKYMYIYMDILNVVTTDWKDTIIYQLTETTTDVWTIRYYHRTKWVVVIWACWEWNDIFWYSNNAIYQSNWASSQKVKVYWKNELATTFSTTSQCTISEGIFKICDWTTIWEYWHKKPWYNPVLIKKTRGRTVSAIDWRIEVSYDWSSKAYWWRDNQFATAQFVDYSVTSLPYSANDFLVNKEGTYIRIWHILPAYSTYTSTGTLCSIVVKVLTDEMDQKWVTTPLTIATITTPSTWVAERFTDIESREIVDVIANAWYNPDFNYIKLIIEWNRWDLATTLPEWINLWRKTPKVFWLKLYSNEIKWN